MWFTVGQKGQKKRPGWILLDPETSHGVGEYLRQKLEKQTSQINRRRFFCSSLTNDLRSLDFHTFRPQISNDTCFLCWFHGFEPVRLISRQESVPFTARWWDMSFSARPKSKDCHNKHQLLSQTQCHCWKPSAISNVISCAIFPKSKLNTLQRLQDRACSIIDKARQLVY